MSFVLMEARCDHRAMANVRDLPAGESAVVIRLATPDDAADLRRLAALDSARTLRGSVLVAETGGVVRAAYSVDERRAIADPFVATAGLVALLQTRADLLRDARPQRARGLRRLRLSPARS
jgi:hypothetical protein